MTMGTVNTVEAVLAPLLESSTVFAKTGFENVVTLVGLGHFGRLDQDLPLDTVSRIFGEPVISGNLLMGKSLKLDPFSHLV